jgi:hypothetical protein
MCGWWRRGDSFLSDAAVADSLRFSFSFFPLYPLCIYFFLEGVSYSGVCVRYAAYTRTRGGLGRLVDLNWPRKNLGLTRAGPLQPFRPKETAFHGFFLKVNFLYGPTITAPYSTLESSNSFFNLIFICYPFLPSSTLPCSVKAVIEDRNKVK